MQDIKSQIENGPFAGYGGEELPLAEYAQLLGIYSAGFGAFVLAAKTAKISLPKRIELGDLLLLGISTYKLSRVISKDRVISPLRAPFATYEGPGDNSELKEKPRGVGLQRAVGDLVTCPWCTGVWAAAALTYAFVLTPGAARVIGSILSASAVSDFLHLSHDALVKETK